MGLPLDKLEIAFPVGRLCSERGNDKESAEASTKWLTLTDVLRPATDKGAGGGDGLCGRQSLFGLLVPSVVHLQTIHALEISYCISGRHPPNAIAVSGKVTEVAQPRLYPNCVGTILRVAGGSRWQGDWDFPCLHWKFRLICRQDSRQRRREQLALSSSIPGVVRAQIVCNAKIAKRAARSRPPYSVGAFGEESDLDEPLLNACRVFELEQVKQAIRTGDRALGIRGLRVGGRPIVASDGDVRR